MTQRGNNRQDVFFTDDDRLLYLVCLREQAGRYGLAVQGFCLMTNHVHLIVTPRGPESLARAVGRADYLYTQAINRRHGRSGHLWQNRFFSAPLDEEHFWTALACVEQNPVRAGLARRAWCCAWSSAGAHIGGGDDHGLLDLVAWRSQSKGLNWREVPARRQDEDTIRRVQHATHTGRPLGGGTFIAGLEEPLQRRLRPRPAGRPRKPGATDPQPRRKPLRSKQRRKK